MWPSPCSLHDRQEGADAVDDAVQVDADDPVPHAHRAGPRVAGAEHAGVVAQHVGRAVVVERLLGEGLHALLERGVDRPPAARRHPHSVSWASTLRRRTSSTSASTTFIPSPTNRVAIALPMPLPAPVTTATLPSRCSMARHHTSVGRARQHPGAGARSSLLADGVSLPVDAAAAGAGDGAQPHRVQRAPHQLRA